MQRLFALGLLFTFASFSGGCNEQTETEPGRHSQQNLTTCPEQRPQICTYEYNPVCGLRDTGVRCVTTPCPSSEWKTYGNACTACADNKVSVHYPGKCQTEES
ncbi:MAG: hypothetical protein R3352_04625 [Salinisphaeraceae bacterium]|nr:hypothetical protein [Salinisphaeraceae bacterium]